jgi:hypothetical protein
MQLSRTSICFAGLGAILGLSATGCVQNESSLFVQGVLALDSGDCTASPDPGAELLASGTMDRWLTDRYMGALLVGNQMVPRGSADQIRTETARVSLRGAEVRISSTEGANLREFSVDGTGFVGPASGTAPGYGILFATLIPSTSGLGDNVIATVKVFGRTLGGREMESGELAFPIKLCDGCLIDYPTDADDTAQPGYQCARASDAALETPCMFGQDEMVDCRLCAATVPQCQNP